MRNKMAQPDTEKHERMAGKIQNQIHAPTIIVH